MTAYLLPSLFIAGLQAAGQPHAAGESVEAFPATCAEACSADSKPAIEPRGAELSSDRLPQSPNGALPPDEAALGVAVLAPSAFAEPPLDLAASTAGQGGLAGEDQAPGMAKPGTSYGPGTFWRQATSIPLRFGAATAAISIGGFTNWKWGSSKFKFNSEGWFGKETSSLGMDKLGHAYSTYVLTEFFTDGIKGGPNDPTRSYTGAILAMGLMTYVEVFDGFSVDHGFSHEDLLVDAAGAVFSIARRSIPGLRDKVDFRLLYVPSADTWDALSCLPAPHCDKDGAAVRGPVTDYSGQRYLMALKFSGFEAFRETPLRLLELHAGYYARGFTKEEEDRGDPLKRRIFFGAGVNVAELLFPGRRKGVAGLAKWGLQYVQVPYTAVHSN